MKLFPRVAIPVAAVLLAVSAIAAAKKDGPVDLSLTDAEGKKVHLKDYRGKVVVLNFWATWCGPCREEMPMMVKAEAAWKEKGVVFVGASLDEKETRKNIPAFLEKFHVSFPVWIGATGSDVDRLGLGGSVPDTAFLNAEGIVVSRIMGEMREAELEERLAWLTGDQKGPAPAPLVRHLEK